MMISVVIRTLNESRHLDELLVAIRNQRLREEQLEVVLIDSGSTDKTLEIAQNHGCRITHIDKRQFSFGRSLNMGSDFAKGDILVYISGHCIPCDSDWISRLVGPLVDGQADYVYGRQIGRDTTKYSEGKIFEKYFPPHMSNSQLEFFCNNANAAIRTESWREFLFDEEVTGLEDLELAKRLCDSGGKIMYVPDAGVYHIHEESWSQTKRRYEREAIALQKIMPEIHITFRDFLRYLTSSIFLDMRTAGVDRRLLREFIGILKFRFAQYYGSYVGNHDHRRLTQRRKESYFYPGEKFGDNE